MIRIMLDAASPMSIAWGPSFIQFYNDAYRPILGATKHPAALGASAKDTFAEIWHIIGPMFEQVLHEGKAVGLNDILLPLDRFGYIEECYFTLSYSPIRDDEHAIQGVLVTMTETTERVLAERRLRVLRTLAERAGTVSTIEQASGLLGLTLQESPYDVPFALLYLLENDAKSARLIENIRFPDDLLSGHHNLNLQKTDACFWPLAQVAASEKAWLIDLELPSGTSLPDHTAWPEPVRQAYVAPVTRPERDYPYGLLVLGVSPRRAFDTTYADFFTLLTEHAATALANAKALEVERERMEALLEIDRLKTAFFSNISHEFRTPLTLMLGPLEDALTQATEPKEQERLDLLLRNAMRILKLVNNLLDFARLESGRTDAVFEPTDLCNLTTDIASSFRSAIERAGMGFEVDCKPFEGAVYVDRQLWEKVVLNLLSNAFKFTFRGKITLRQYREGNQVVVQVKDTGIGIPEEELSRIFERFHRVHNTNSRTHEGAGIGLALVQEIVRLHGGTIVAESQEGIGTTFTLTLPMGRAHLPADKIETKRSLISTAVNSRAYVEEALHWLPDAPPNAEPKRFFAFGKPYVLIVDDNADMRTYIQRILEDHYNVETAHDGEEALAIIQQRRPDLVLADVMMPRLDGFAMLERLRQNPETHTVPVLLLSARAGEEARIEGLRLGADDYIVKPFSARELLTRVGTTFSMAQLRQRSESEFKNLIMQSPVAVGIFRGKTLTLAIANDSLLKMWNRDQDVIGRPLLDILPELQDQEFPIRLAAVLANGQAYHSHEEKIALQQGETLQDRYFSYVAQPLWQSGGLIDGVSVLINEVTPQALLNQQLTENEAHLRNLAAELEGRVQDRTRELQNANLELVRSNQELEQFAYVASHDLREPLRKISVFGDRLVKQYREVLSGDGELYITRMQDSARRMEQMIDDLLNFSRVARADGRFEPIDLNTVLANALRDLEIALGKNDAVIELPDGPLPTIDASGSQLEKYFLNMLSNALKFAREGVRPYIEIRHELVGASESQVPAPKPGVPYLRLTIRDNGIGFEQEYAERIFGLFQRLHGRSDYQGSGIGLSICRKIAENHQGNVKAEGYPGEGAAFTLTVPVRQ